ncbi:MAG: ABC transporter permease [Chloroflexi bacterium]|nr:ABC transporter permease [Chloroflexota bacterium]MBU1748422.1 ABC transporter permease [Chloroflexota bacterium]MBU1878096.1 ABC transporter permease [Chloroflexota bacterium]
MSVATREARATYAFVERNFNLVKRYWGWEIVWLAYSIANSLAITFIGAGMEQLSGVMIDTSRMVFYLLVGTLVWHYLAVVFDQVSEMIAWERWEGTIEYTFMAPVHRVTQMAGTCIFSTIYALLHTGIILVAVSFFFQIDLTKANLLGALMVILAGSLSFIGLGIMAAVLPLLFTERGAQMTHVVQAVLLLVSGVYYPIDVLPEWMQFTARLSPATYVLDGMRAALLDGAGLDALMGIVALLLASGLVTIPVGLLVFRWGERYAKRTGRLARGG